VYISSHQDERSLPRQFENITISTVDQKVIYDNELIRYLNVHGAYKHQAKLLGDKKYAKKAVRHDDGLLHQDPREFYVNYDEYESDERPKPSLDDGCDNEKFPGVLFEAEASNLANPGQVRYVTPEAVEVRRQVKDLEIDLLDIRTDRGWYGLGGKRDVPRDACFVGHYGDCYVWVCQGGVRDLSILTIKTLKFATLIKDDSILTVPGPRFTPASGFPVP
jgi:hypothetical protein